MCVAAIDAQVTVAIHDRRGKIVTNSGQRMGRAVQVKHNIFKITVLTLIMAVLVIGVLVQRRAQGLAEQQAALIEDNFLAAKRVELKHYVDLALSAIRPLYESGRNDIATQNQAKSILGAVNFGDDGYFFVYDLAGNNLVHPRKPELVGQNLLELTDPHGRFVIQSLLYAAMHGDGYQDYAWEKPSTRKMTDKLGYVVLLERWGWMVGTGVYLDDVESATHAVRERAATTLQGLVIMALAAVLAVFVCGLVLSMREYRRAESTLKIMAQRIVSLQEEERARVSRELHDGISQLLVATKFHFELAQHKLANRGTGAMDDLHKGVSGLTDAIGEVRRISHDLRPSVLDTLGLAAATKQLAAEFQHRTGVRVDIVSTLGQVTLPEPEAVALFRTAQEALTNIERHASATVVTITLALEPEQVRLEIVDNGCGFNVDHLKHASGIGLCNIRERIDHLGGSFDFTSTPGSTRLVVNLPKCFPSTPSPRSFPPVVRIT